MTRCEHKKEDTFALLLEWDIDRRLVEKQVRKTKAAVLVRPAGAFLANLQNIDNLLLSPFVVAADGVHQFYWAMEYVGAYAKQLASMLKGEAPVELVESRGQKDRILEANGSFRELLSTPEGLDNFAHQIDARLKELVQRPEFRAAIRVQLLSATVLIWAAYETLCEDLRPIRKRYQCSDAPGTEKDLAGLRVLKEYRNLIVHRAAVVDEKFKRRTASEQPIGAPLIISTKMVAGFFNSVAEVGITSLSTLDELVQNQPLVV